MEGTKRTRSRKGCQTCRRRKVRCDERHPACGACLRLRLQCQFVDANDTVSSHNLPQTRRARYRVRFASAQTGRAGNSSPLMSPPASVDYQRVNKQSPLEASTPSTPPGESPDSNAQLSPHSYDSRQGVIEACVSLTAARQFQAAPREAHHITQSQPWLASTSYQPGRADAPVDALNTTAMDPMMLGAMEFQANMTEVSSFEGRIDALWDVLPAFDDLLSTGFGYPNSGSSGIGHQGSPCAPFDRADDRIARAEAQQHEISPSALPQATSPLSLLALASTTPPYIQRSPQPTPTEPVYTHTPPPPPLTDVPAAATGAMVVMKPEDREPLQHFLTTMVQFVKLRSSNSDNIYCYIFTNMALTHAPLYESILAWAALHKAHIKSASTSDAELRYQRASRLLYEDTQGAAGHVDFTIVTIWFLLQYELFLAKGVTRFVALLDYAASVIRPLFDTSSPAVIHERLGPVALRVVIWLSAYDARAAPFGGNCHLLQCLKTYMSDQEVLSSEKTTPVDTDTGADARGAAMQNSNGPPQPPSEYDESSLNGIFGGITSEPTSEMQACLRLALRLNIARGSCSLLGRCGWWSTSTDFDREKHAAAWEAVRSSIISIKKRLEAADAAPAVKMALRVAGGDVDVPPADLGGALQFNWMQLVAIYYGCILIYQTNRPSSVASPSRRASESDPTFPAAADSAARIVRLSRHATLARPSYPHCIWSHLLFQAGVEVKDPIYQSWAVDTLSRAETLSPNLRKTRHLLERVIKLRRDVKGPCDVPAVMEAVGEVFVL